MPYNIISSISHCYVSLLLLFTIILYIIKMRYYDDGEMYNQLSTLPSIITHTH